MEFAELVTQILVITEKIVFATMDFMELLINAINAILLVENAMVQAKAIA